VDSYPYTVEKWMPELLTKVLAEHAYDPIPISTTIRKCASNFKRTQQDTWHEDSKRFNEVQLSNLATLLAGTSYCESRIRPRLSQTLVTDILIPLQMPRVGLFWVVGDSKVAKRRQQAFIEVKTSINYKCNASMLIEKQKKQDIWFTKNVNKDDRRGYRLS
jgi:hypothetical protein